MKGLGMPQHSYIKMAITYTNKLISYRHFHHDHPGDRSFVREENCSVVAQEQYNFRAYLLNKESVASWKFLLVSSILLFLYLINLFHYLI